MLITPSRHGLVVSRGVAVGLHHAVIADALERFGRGAEGDGVVLLVADIIPHGKEHLRERVGRPPAYLYAAVEPVPEPLALVDILVRQVNAAGEGGHAVHDADLAVVPVVSVPVGTGWKRWKVQQRMPTDSMRSA